MPTKNTITAKYGITTPKSHSKAAWGTPNALGASHTPAKAMATSPPTTPEEITRLNMAFI
jgi:hypothetical protein